MGTGSASASTGPAGHGSAFDWILRHYYTGTEVTPGLANDDVRVLVASGVSVAAASEQTFTAVGETFDPGSYTLTPGPGTITFTGRIGQIRFGFTPRSLVA
jgi:hypothetical protein